jgi:hypothetical protein
MVVKSSMLLSTASLAVLAMVIGTQAQTPLSPSPSWTRAMPTGPRERPPPVNGFWSLSIYNEHHFFVANPINLFRGHEE